MTKKIRGANRSNVVPAKVSGRMTNVEYINNKQINLTKDLKKTRKNIIDLCDTCFKEIEINRMALRLRHRGWRNMCRSCWNKKGKPNCKDNKIWLQFIFNRNEKELK